MFPRSWSAASTDRDFPKKHPRNLLFPDHDIDALRKAGIPLRKAADLDRDEDFLFEALRTRARNSLALSWPSHDAGGKSVQSSASSDAAESFNRNASVLPARARRGTSQHPAFRAAWNRPRS